MSEVCLDDSLCVSVRRTARHHAHGLVGDHRDTVLIDDVVHRRDDAAVALTGRPDIEHFHFGMHGIAGEDRFQNFLLNFKQRQPRGLHRRLNKQTLDDGVSAGRRYNAALNGTMVVIERKIRENRLDHAGDANELNEVSLGDRPIERPELLALGEIIPVKPYTNCLHGYPLSFRAKGILRIIAVRRA